MLILISCISCNIIKKSSYNPNAKYSSSQLHEDFSILTAILKTNHPSLYWYSTPDSISSFFDGTYNSIQDSLTEEQFRKRVAWALSKIHCGHTIARPSKAYSKYFTTRKTKLFPFYLKVWGDSAVVINNLTAGDKIIKRGTAVTAINGTPIKNVVDSICQLISADGYSNIFKYQVISFNFPAFYKNAYGLDSTYRVGFIDSTGTPKEIVCKNFEGNVASLRSTQQLLPIEMTRKNHRRFSLLAERNLEIDSSLKTAIISINTFSTGKLIRFFRSSFKQIKNSNIENVVIDLRLNSGGSVMACTRLCQYLVDKPFHVADTVAAYTRSFRYKRYIKPWLIYWLSMHLSGRKYEDKRIHFQYFEKHYFKPKNKNHFNGNIYILTGGYTFSAATLVAGNLKDQHNVTLVGEETGGGAYGNSAMLLTNIVLPNTGLRITLPLYRMVLNTHRIKNGRGIFPDVEVTPSSESIRKNEDRKLERVLQMIRKKDKIH
ncbi:S41 family peptidase [Segetibacter koreensis]|uniref:S41 family peptidase n=1 Tax=Segetibacter koreensis TaxID=398037 RepID=UPI0003700F72|nr:S41 family peptidase [Segetibacter koreensis]